MMRQQQFVGIAAFKTIRFFCLRCRGLSVLCRDRKLKLVVLPVLAGLGHAYAVDGIHLLEITVNLIVGGSLQAKSSYVRLANLIATTTLRGAGFGS
jgi:hypothetical protein